jgi:FdhE protein
MVSSNDDIETLAAEIERMRTEQPHLDSLLKAFGPLILAKTRWFKDGRGYTKIFPVDPVKYAGGIPLSQQCRLFLPDDPWQSAGLAVAEAVSQGFPDSAGDMAGLKKQIEDGSLDCFTLMNSPAVSDDAQCTAQAADLAIEPQLFQLFLRFLGRFMLSKRAQDMAAELAPLSWKKGYCPVCGSFPHLAIIRDKGEKWLQCPDCSHEWQFPRLACPYCGQEDPENTNLLFVEGKKEDTAYTCSNCRKYLVTSARSGDLGQIPADLIAISLTPLDLILQEKGFMPMAGCERDTFVPPCEKED